ncbi:hypothetical protein UFOVP1655_61 [uncultured Caudovirales phage]|jgi:hypothetical protein|uniref:Uncharacterized protein n=1 Tax=uncultured Caudovirales phage TaxID=2100421 RepID=A0A6J5T345_9CAUD|nr:hypothetical protein UFOVP1655_61 [uncultured Caudovirales phage]
MDVTEIGNLIQQYGFPIVAAGYMLKMVKYVWSFTIEQINPVLGEASKELITLIDRIRLLDNDLLRLTAKLNTVLQMRENAQKQKNEK